MRKAKRFLAILMSVMLLVNALPIITSAEGGQTDTSGGANFGALLAANKPGNYTIDVGETITLISDHGKNDWSVNAGGIVNFNDRGNSYLTVTGLKIGNVTVTHRYSGENGKGGTESWIISVTGHPTGVVISGPDSVSELGSAQLKADIQPAGATGTILWTSSDPSLATVDDSGRVTGIAATGEKVTITAAVRDTDIAAGKEMTVSSVTPVLGGADTVAEFRTAALKVSGIPAGIATKITWSSGNTALANVDNNGIVSGVAATAAGETAEIDALVEMTGENGNAKTVLLKKNMTVVRAVSNKSAKFYYLKTPTSNPASNATADWGRHFGNGNINIDNGSWNGINLFIADAQNRVISWPSGFANGNIPRGGQDWNAIVGAYKSVLKQMGITENDIDSIVMHPYKISNNGGGDFHVDCTVEIRAKAVATATFYLWDAGGNAYIWKAAQNIRVGDTVSLPNALKSLPESKTAGNRKYRLVRWYDNAALGGSSVTFPYTVEENVNFYAKYIPGYLVTYDPNGGTLSPSIPVETKEEGNTILVRSSVPTREGSNFRGWKLSTDGTVKNGGDSFAMPSGDVTLTAQWEAKSVVTITSGSETRTYDGAEHVNRDYSVTLDGNAVTMTEFRGELGSGHYIVITPDAGAVIRDAGSKVNGFTAKICGAGDQEVTNLYSVTESEGTLTVKPAVIMLTADSATKEYDGTPLAKETWRITDGAFAPDEGLETVTVAGSRTLTGSSDNIIIAHTLKENTKADNYDIVYLPGTLEITDRTDKYAIEVEANSYEGTYDGQEHRAEGFKALTFTVDGRNYTVSGIGSAAAGTDAADSVETIPVTGTPVVTDDDGNDVTGQFDVRIIPGRLMIKRADLVLVSADLSREYDGTALTNGSALLVTEAGWIGTEGAEYIFTGSQTFVGSGLNTFDCIANPGTNLGNYEIARTEGTLTVTDPGMIPGTKTHADGTYKAGDTVIFTLSATNIYDRPVEIAFGEQKGVTVAQPVFTDVQPGETVTTTAAYTLGMPDALARSYTNTVAIRVDETVTNVTDTVTVAEPEFALTIRYMFVGGGEAAGTHYQTGFRTGDTFVIETPAIDGYTADRSTTEGIFVHSNVEITVFYRPDPISEPEPAAEPEAEPGIAGKPGQAAETGDDTEPGTKPEAEPAEETGTKPKTESTAETGIIIKPEQAAVPVADTEPETKPEAESTAETGIVIKPEQAAVPVADTEPETKPEAESAAETGTVNKPEEAVGSDTDTATETKPEVETAAEPETTPAPASNAATTNNVYFFSDVYSVPLGFEGLDMNTGDCAE